MHCPTLEDLRAVKQQLRRIFIKNQNGDEYGWIHMPATAFKKELGRWKQLVVVTASLAGKYFG